MGRLRFSVLFNGTSARCIAVDGYALAVAGLKTVAFWLKGKGQD